MEKSPFTREHRILAGMLREYRERASLTQQELAGKLAMSQSFLSKWERGERRIDVIQLRTWCRHVGTTLPRFIKTLEGRLTARRVVRRK